MPFEAIVGEAFEQFGVAVFCLFDPGELPFELFVWPRQFERAARLADFQFQTGQRRHSVGLDLFDDASPRECRVGDRPGGDDSHLSFAEFELIVDVSGVSHVEFRVVGRCRLFRSMHYADPRHLRQVFIAALCLF